MRATFEHVASRVVLGLQSQQDTAAPKPAVVLAGGVAANSLLRQMCVYPMASICGHFCLMTDVDYADLRPDSRAPFALKDSQTLNYIFLLPSSVPTMLL